MVTFLVVLILLALAVLLLAISILIKKNGKFPDTHIEDNQHLKKYGICCAMNDEYECSCYTKAIKSNCESCSLSSCELKNK